jgi:hypothetical protein
MTLTFDDNFDTEMRKKEEMKQQLNKRFNCGSFFWLQRHSSSELQFVIVKTDGAASKELEILMDIEKLENGTIACTNYTIQELISSEEELPCTASCLQQFQGNKRWQEIMSSAVILRDVMKTVVCLQSLSLQTNSVRVSIRSDWEIVTKPAIKSFEYYSAFQRLPHSEKSILRKEAAIEAVLIQMMVSYDKKATSHIHTALRGHIRIGVQISMFKNDNHLYNLMYSLAHELQDFLRKDEVVMTILTLCSLFKQRPGLSFRQVIQDERGALFHLLEKYIESREWTTISSEDVWNMIHTFMAKLASLKVAWEEAMVRA